MHPSLAFLSVALLTSALASGCAGPGKYVWYRDLPQTERGVTASDYTIGVGDSIAISVYEQTALSTTVKVRRDGKVALPLVGELVVAGKQPLAVARELEQRFKEYVVGPRVTVNVEQSQPVVVTALGEVTKVGALTLESPTRLIQALAQAGGPTDYADKDRVFVLRQFPTFQRIRFTYEAVLRNEGGAGQFPLLTGDVIVVE